MLHAPQTPEAKRVLPPAVVAGAQDPVNVSRSTHSLINAGNSKPDPATAASDDAEVAQRRPVRVLVSELLDGGREAILEHAGQDYRLRITANGKLILTK